eukprot:scaffold267382_cov31-Tisochrysis_lutea.AAC.2
MASSHKAESSLPSGEARLIVLPPFMGLRTSATPDGASAALARETVKVESHRVPRGTGLRKIRVTGCGGFAAVCPGPCVEDEPSTVASRKVVSFLQQPAGSQDPSQ